jgi:hypothetical protein
MKLSLFWNFQPEEGFFFLNLRRTGNCGIVQTKKEVVQVLVLLSPVDVPGYMMN